MICPVLATNSRERKVGSFGTKRPEHPLAAIKDDRGRWHRRAREHTLACMKDPVEHLKRLIRDIPDFPKPGILFRDITPLLADASGLALSVELLANPFRGKNIDLVVGAESRGFIFGTAVACCLSAGFSLVRKPGKLPFKKVSMSYDLEYGKDTLEMHADAIVRGQRVLVVDDVLATGGTMKACCDLVKQLGGEIAGVAVLTELSGLNGREKVAPHKVHSVIQY
jgi:adenine phosphoribosyltransferase